MGDLTLYWLPGSPWCWRPLAVLKEKGLAFESKLLDRSTAEHKSEAMLKLNSRGQVPVFTDGDAVVSDSMAIMQYLEATYPSVPLLPNGKADLALACQRLHETSCLYNTVQPPFYAKMAGKVNTDEEKERFQQGIEATLKEMNYFEEYLSDGRSFLIGEMFTLADVSLAVYLFFCEHFGATLDKHPNLKKFADRIRERPCFKETWPAEWLENEGNSGMDFLGDL